MDKRKHRRNVPKIQGDNTVTYQTVNEHPGVNGQGTLVDISEHGCRVRDNHRLRKGLRIQVALPNEAGKAPTILANCIVAWAKEGEFGVQFLW